MAGEHEVVIHAGIHKTGTTSIQYFMHANRDALRAHDVDYYSGVYRPENHVELHLASLRRERDSNFKLSSGIVVNDRLVERIGDRVRRYIAGSACRRVVFSNEGLSLLRYPDEMARLKAMIPTERIQIILYTRSAEGFLRSYSRQLLKDPRALPKVIDKDSFAYTAADSWLVDFKDRIDRFRSAFGSSHVSVVDYDEQMRTIGNVIPSFLSLIGIDAEFKKAEWGGMFLNRSSD